jgi:hypothetical protein
MIILYICIIVLCLLFLQYMITNNESYTSYIRKEGPEELGLVSNISNENINTDCSVYNAYINKKINKSYYRYPRFLNPREACKDQCISGVWSENEEHTYGSHACCRQACEVITKGPEDV